MPIPDRLKLRPPSRQILAEMSALCDDIEREIESSGSAEELLQRWHSYARRRYEPHEFQTYRNALSKDTFVHSALNPEPSFDADATYAESLAVLDAVSTASVPESESDYYLGWLDAQFPNSNISDLICWPDEWFGDSSLFRDADGTYRSDVDLTNDQILGYAMARSGRTLRGAPSNVVLPFPMPPSAA